MKAIKLQVGNIIKFTDFTSTSPFVRFPKDLNKHEYIVESAKSDGEGYGHGRNDYYPPGWTVVVRRLDPDGSYNAKRKTFEFVQPEFGGSFSNTIKSEYIAIVRKMKKVSAFVEA